VTVGELIEALTEFDRDAEIHLDVRMDQADGAAGELHHVESEEDGNGRRVWLVS